MKCNKVKYRDRVGAMLVLSKLANTTNSRRREKRIYSCPKCHHYHITSESKEDKK